MRTALALVYNLSSVSHLKGLRRPVVGLSYRILTFDCDSPARFYLSLTTDSMLEKHSHAL